jgi:hypothetical protein
MDSDSDILPYNVSELIKEALKQIHEGNGGLMMNTALFEASFHNLLGAIETGYGSVAFDRPDFEFVSKLRESAKYFAARKTILQVIQLTALTIDEENGTSRSFSEFRRLSKGVIGNYNRDWLQTEYSTALMAARSAREWQDFEADADLFPNLEYMRTISAHPREQHLKYVGTIRAINDPFWITHYPPIDWYCSCSVKNTDEGVTDIPDNIDETDPVSPALQNNPGKTAQLFNVMKSSYGEKTTEIPDTDIEKELKTSILPNLNFYIPAYQGKNGGSLDIHPGVDKSEFVLNTKNGFALAKGGYSIKIEPKRFIVGQSDPDLLINGKRADFKAPTSKTAINTRVKVAQTQQCEYVVFSINREDWNNDTLAGGLREALGNTGKNTYIKKVIIHYNDNDQLIEFNRKELKTNESILSKLK